MRNREEGLRRPRKAPAIGALPNYVPGRRKEVHLDRPWGGDASLYASEGTGTICVPTDGRGGISTE